MGKSSFDLLVDLGMLSWDSTNNHDYSRFLARDLEFPLHVPGYMYDVSEWLCKHDDHGLHFHESSCTGLCTSIAWKP